MRIPRKTRKDMDRNEKNSFKNIHERPKNHKNSKNAQKFSLLMQNSLKLRCQSYWLQNQHPPNKLSETRCVQSERPWYHDHRLHKLGQDLHGTLSDMFENQKQMIQKPTVTYITNQYYFFIFIISFSRKFISIIIIKYQLNAT